MEIAIYNFDKKPGPFSDHRDSRSLLDHGADVNAHDHKYWTPIHFASLASRSSSPGVRTTAAQT
jgi:ankyrin repeat protein